MFKSFIGLIGLSCLFFSHFSVALDCNSSGGIVTIPAVTIDSPNNLSIGSLLNSSGLSSSSSITYMCSGSPTAVGNAKFGMKATGKYLFTAADGTFVYETGIAGIGYGLAGYVSECRTLKWINGEEAKILSDKNSVLFCDGKYGNSAYIFVAKANFYKTAEKIESKEIPLLKLGETVLVVDGKTQKALNVNLAGGVVTTSGCFINNRDLQVMMGQIGKNQFAGQGTTANAQNVDISITCPQQVKVALTMDSQFIQNAENGLLDISKDGSANAEGIGIQLLYNGSPLKLQQPISIGDIVGSYYIPLQARYYQSGPTIKPGTANSTATFNLTYQ